MRKHRLGKQLLIVLCVSLLVFLAGCRPSPVLEQIIYEQQHEIDEDLETQALDDDPENEEQDEDIPPRETMEDAEQVTDEERTAALAGDTDTESEEPDAVYDVAYDVYGDLSEPDEADPAEGSTSEKAVGSGGTDTEEGRDADVSEGQETGTEDVSGNEPEDGGNADADDGSASGTDYQPTNEPTGEPRQVVDAAGRYVEVPQNVDSVTAVGEVATMVEMLGGSGRLVGSSSSFTGSNRIRSTFDDLAGVNTWWSGDGSSPCDSFDALLAARPDVCFEISGQDTFTDAQRTALDEAGIAYVVLPRLNSLENIEYAVTIVGEVLGDRAADGGTNANSLAADYCDWADRVIKQVSNAGGSDMNTVYISNIDTEATWYISNATAPVWWGPGVPVSMKKEKSAPLNECMTLAHLTNRGRDNQYVEPLHSNHYVSSISGSGDYDDTLTAINYSYRLGNSNGNYPAVIVADSQIADYLMDRGVDSYGYWHWRVGEYLPVGNTFQYGFYDDGREGKVVLTYIEGGYWIYVNPSGVGSWADGSVESPLEAAWLSCKFQGGVSESDLQSMVSEFYNKFYPAGASLPNISEEYYIER